MSADRRTFLTSAGSALTASLFTGQMRGANGRISMGFIGVGGRGFQNLRSAINEPDIQISAICDVYKPNLDTAITEAERNGHKPKAYKDFRELLTDKSIDAVVISTPDHWHAIMTVEACKAGKDVYVEKPVCTYVAEAPKMLEAMRKYKRVVQGGTNSRSAGHMAAVREVIQSGKLGAISSAHVRNLSLDRPEGIGNAPDQDPPPGLDWDLWLGPAPQRRYNQNRFWTVSGPYASFRFYWDYAGGQETDNGIHIVDLLHMAFGETAPLSVSAYGGKKYLKDARETPDTFVAVFEYPEFIMEYEMRYSAAFTGGVSDAILVHGSQATLAYGRGPSYRIYPERLAAAPAQGAGRTPWAPGDPTSVLYGGNTPTPPGGRAPDAGGAAAARAGAAARRTPGMTAAQMPQPSEEKNFEPAFTHMGNFLECMRNRQKPIADLEYCARSSCTVILANVAYRSKVRVDFDWKTWTSPQKEAKPFLEYHYRAPWKLEV